jgi:hypothetical protein
LPSPNGGIPGAPGIPPVCLIVSFSNLTDMVAGDV